MIRNSAEKEEEQAAVSNRSQISSDATDSQVEGKRKGNQSDGFPTDNKSNGNGYDRQDIHGSIEIIAGDNALDAGDKDNDNFGEEEEIFIDNMYSVESDQIALASLADLPNFGKEKETLKKGK